MNRVSSLITSSTFAIQAKYLFPGDSPPLVDGILSISGGRILAVGENRFDSPPIHLGEMGLGDVALLPGLVNAHTHLEFSHLSSPLGAPGLPFPDWIRSVIHHRREMADQVGSPEALIQHRAESIAAGLAESFASGVTILGEIATPGWPQRPFLESPVSSIIFLELLGLSADRQTSLLELAAEHLSLLPQTSSLGLSPHAPYTASPELVQRAVELSAGSKTPVAMHLAETVEELELLQSASGPLVELLRDLEAWDATAIPRGIRPLDYLKQLAGAHRAIVVHGNYLDEEEMEFLAEHRASMAVAYCPRTHAYFGHGDYPLSEMLQAGVIVALGTDSRASNPDLNLFEEMRFVAARHSEIPLESVWKMGALHGAIALGVDHEVGSLAPGKRADLTLVSLPPCTAPDPYELLFDPQAKVIEVIKSLAKMDSRS